MVLSSLAKLPMACWVLLALAAPVVADEVAAPSAAEPTVSTTASTSATAEPPARKAPWRGSMLTLRNEVSLLTFDKGAELTYNPYDALTFEVRPRWWFGDVFYAALDFSLTRELTAADDTTRSGETWLGDLAVGGGAARFWTIPWVGVDLTADARVLAPTSKLSQARTLLVGLRGSLMLSRHFPLLEGLDVTYMLIGNKGFHRYSTSELDAPLIGGCSGDASECDRFRNTGYRNAGFRLTNGLNVSLDVLPWLGAEATAMHLVDYLYPMNPADPRVSLVPQEPANDRQYLWFEGEVRFKPMKSLGIGVGVSTFAPLLAPDSTIYTPFVNRYTMAYVELRLFVDGLIAQIVPETASK
jgi:hypothetical protein